MRWWWRRQQGISFIQPHSYSLLAGDVQLYLECHVRTHYELFMRYSSNSQHTPVRHQAGIAVPHRVISLDTVCADHRC